MVRGEWLFAGVVDDQLEAHALRIAEAQRAFGALAADAVLPEVERLLGGDAEDDSVHHAGACAPLPCARVFEERDVGAWAAFVVGVMMAWGRA